MSANRREFLQTAGALSVCFAVPGWAGDDARPSAGQAALGNRIIINATGTATLKLGKVELGQGIGTAIAQLVADELGIDFSRMQLSQVDTDSSPDESYTFSSISVQQSGPPVQKAAAAGRQYLLEIAAEKLNVQFADLRVLDGDILIGNKPSGLDYWQLLSGQEFVLSPDDSASPQPASAFRAIGHSVERLDLPAKVFGEATFLQDLRLPGMVHARVVRPPAERAQLVTYDDEIAAKLPGVLKVVRDGNFLAVVARREGQARKAAVALKNSLQWSLANDLPEQTRLYEWMKGASSRVEPVASREAESATDVETKTLRATYQRPYQAHGSISPSAAVAQFQDAKLTVWSHAQGMYPLRAAIAHAVGLVPDDVRCIHHQAAGCFGHNGADDAACDAAAIAMKMPGVPVRLQWERADEFAWEPYGSAMHIETRADLTPDGRIVNWDYDLWSCPHTSRPRAIATAGNLIYAQHKEEPLGIPPPQSIPQPVGGSDRNAVPLYAFDSFNVTKHLVTDVPVRVSALRSLGAYANVFAIESFMDEIALAAGQDPFAFHIAHLDDARAVALMERLRDVSNWSNRPEAGGGHGWGLGFAQFKNLSSYVGVVVELEVDGDNGEILLNRATAVCDCGLVINPDGVRAQIEGGIVQSASWTLKEEMRFSKLRIESRDWAGYPILRFDEIPEIRVVLMPGSEQKSLGVGEAAQGPTAAAIANAVFHASGQRLRQLPLTPQRFADTQV